MLVELGLTCNDDVIELQLDSAAGKSSVSWRGLGKMRHMQLRNLWMQHEDGDAQRQGHQGQMQRQLSGCRNEVLVGDRLGKRSWRCSIGTRISSSCVHQKPD